MVSAPSKMLFQYPEQISPTQFLLAATSGAYSSSGWVLYGFPLSPPLKGAFCDTNCTVGRKSHTKGTSQARDNSPDQFPEQHAQCPHQFLIPALLLLFPLRRGKANKSRNKPKHSSCIIILRILPAGNVESKRTLRKGSSTKCKPPAARLSTRS